MKIKFLMAGLLAFASATVFAQKGELKTAKEEYDKYESLRQTAGMQTLAGGSLTNAKTAIDKAAAHEKTATLPQTYAVKAAVYGALAAQDSVEATAMPLLTAAEEALKKAKELDTKGDNKPEIENAGRYIAQFNLNSGVKQYQGGKYDVAYNYFDKYRQILPEDTNAIYYTGLSAANASSTDPKYFALAIPHYTKLLTTKYSKNDDIYYELSTLHLMNKDTASALKTVAEGIAKFPTKSNLRSREIEINLIQGKEAEAITKIESAIANDPKNKALYYYAGITYAKVGDVAGQQLKKTKAGAAKTALAQKKQENFDKAATAYKKALEIDPNYADAALNLGYVLINPAIDTYNAANQLPTNQQKEYEAGMAKANKQFDAALPYLQKAVELNPKSPEALTNLKTYYLGKKDVANANKTQKQIEALQGGNSPK
ncbi:hypothetical protein DJ568_04080 [Mucilaginibacter hurinus]|uniref:Tetratricopeptide repeat protein n=1 Tax=Mucilaginibacter hurinus TaxID=2201324 RepID=A0A367GS64_9SPHI|nr:tetratricopeptide repeat protein [Mucilaginibacter hurinus]RCH55938.1 hypothetical protein DJ568_04080 [Mucilaginibacter hurinus]